jgi:glycine cleavage system H lipoate-binding protein/NAD-dependent dihydropyrimidine dehydrogenase PreA subunit/ferredoxin
MISLSIDGKQTTVSPGQSVLEAARGVGIEIPTLCYHKELTANAACRLCTVEVTQAGRTRLIASCALPAEEGMEVRTASERVLAGRRIILELLAARCPEVPQVRELAAQLGARTDRLPRRSEDCILCGLCVAVCAEKVGARVIGFSGRGVTRKVGTPFGAEALECIACGACSYVCPTGAMKMERKTIEREMAAGAPRHCRFMRLGLVPYAICPSAFDCAHCEVDQRAEETTGTHPAFIAQPAKQTRPTEVGGFSLMPERYYHQGHTWVEDISGYLRLGVDDFGQRLIGAVAAIEVLAERGAEVRAGAAIWRLRLASGREITMAAPVTGTMIAINQDLLLDPSLLRKAPYSRGWVCLVKPSQPEAELAALRFKSPSVPYYLRQEPDPVTAWLGGEADRLRRMLAERGASVPTESLGRAGLWEVIPGSEWRAITQAFFGAQA